MADNYFDPSITDPAAIQKAMASNSSAWQANPNNDPTIAASNDALHQANLKYSAATGQTYNPTAGTYSPQASNPGTGTTGTTSSLPSQMVKAATNPTPSSTPTPTGTPPSDGTLHLNVNGQPTSDVPVYKGTSFERASDMASQLGLDYKRDPSTGVITIGGKQINPIQVDSSGEPIVGIRDVANALGLKIGYDDTGKQITITGKSPTKSGGVDQTQQSMYSSPIQSIAQGIPQMQPMTPYQAPDLSGMQSQMLPYQNFNPDWNSYYQSAHNQLDPQFNANNLKLMDKQATDITAMDESMNRRGIFSSGIAQAAEDDLRAKTTNALAAGFTAQMSQIEKQAQTLYQDAVKQAQTGNDFALKNNQALMTNMLNIEKQSFSQWAQTQKLDQSQYSYALKAWDQMAGFIMKDAQNQLAAQKSTLPYEYQTANNAASNATSAANNAANNQTKTDIALLPYQSMTVYQQATTQEKAQMDSAINYFKQQGININESKLMESIRHDQSTEALTANGQQITANHNAATEANAAANTQLNAYKAFGYGPDGKPTLDRSKFDETVQHDKDTIQLARTNAVNSENKTQIDAIGKELSTISSQVNAIISSYTTDPKQQATNIAMVTSLNGQRDKYLNQLKQYTDQGFYTPPSGN